jgi:DNA (cytosine-5)-methyltransferase 1
MYQHNQTDARLKVEPKTSQTVIARFGTGGGHTPLVRHHVSVRKLTPTECERLQGFPDGYTDIMPNTPDGSRYVAIGNSMAVPVMRWIGKRIAGI